MILSEVTQAQIDKCHMVFHVWIADLNFYMCIEDDVRIRSEEARMWLGGRGHDGRLGEEIVVT